MNNHNSSTRGKYVLRSTYQKCKEENKRLLADIKILVEEKLIVDKDSGFVIDANLKKRQEVIKKWQNRIVQEELVKRW